MATAELLLNSAKNNHGIALTPLQVRELATMLVNVSNTATNMGQVLEATDELLRAYIDKYGEELLDEKIAEREAEQLVVVGEVIDDEKDETTVSEGQDDAEPGIHSPSEVGDGEDEVSETVV